MTSHYVDGLSVYLVFGEPGGIFIQAATSLRGAGAAMILHAADVFGTTQLVMLDGSPFELDTIASTLPIDGCVWVRSADGDEPIGSIERRFLAP
jgi:hypothetical protein